MNGEGTLINLSDWIDKHADFTPDKMAVRCGELELTYAEMARDVSRMAAALKAPLGVERGDRVALLAQNTAQTLVIAFACARLGAIFQPLNWRQAAPEHIYVLTDSRPKVLFAASSLHNLIEGIVDDLPTMTFISLDEDAETDWPTYQSLLDDSPEGAGSDAHASLEDSFLLCYTSGTTGRPKGAVLSQNAIFFNAVNSRHMHGLTGDDEVLVTIPLFHVGGMNILSTPSLHVGASLTLTPVFEVGQTFDILEQRGINLTVLVPTQLTAMLAHPRWQTADLSRLRCISSGSTLVPTSLIERIHDKGVPLIQVYGSTETTPLATYLTIETAQRGIGSGGKTALHCQVKVVDDDNQTLPAGKSGEVLVKGPNVLKEYWNDPQSTQQALKDGWFYTGDIGRFDEDGFLYIDDRKKDLIISGSENIYPAMLENILADCPGISEATIVGRPNDKWGEVAIAVVAKEKGAELEAEAVLRHFDGRIGRFAIPHEVIFVDALPRNAMGKVVKDEVRAMVRDMKEA